MTPDITQVISQFFEELQNSYRQPVQLVLQSESLQEQQQQKE